MGIIAAGQITVVDLSDAPVLNTFITASRPTTQTYSKDSHTYKPSYASTPQVLTLKVTKAGSTANIIDSISSLHWFVVDGPIKTEITSKDNGANEYISGAHNEILTTKLDIDLNKGSKRYEVMGIWPDPSTGLDVQFGGYIDLLLTQNGATGPQGPQGDTGNGIANTVITYGLSMSDTTEPATWSSEMPTLVKGMYLWTRTVIIYTNGSSTTSYQISYIAKDADATAEIDKAKQELLEKLETVRDESLEAVDEAKQQLVTVRDESLAAAEEAKQGLANVASELNTAKQELADSVTAVNNKVDSAKAEVTQAKQQLTTVADDLSKAKTDFQNAVSAVDTKATNLQSDLTQAKQDLASQAQQLQEQANAQSELTNRVSSVEETANGTKTTVSELSKTVAQNGKDITSVTARTKVVEDDLAGTKTTLSQVQTTANNTSQKTATLETGLNGLSAKFNSLSVGGVNLFKGSRDFSGSWLNGGAGVYAEDYQGVKIFKRQNVWGGLSQFFEVKTGEEYVFSAYVKSSAKTDRITFFLYHGDKEPTAKGVVSYGSVSGQNSVDLDLTDKYQRIAVKIKITSSGWIAPRLERSNTNAYLFFGGYKLERGNIATDYRPNEADLEQKVAEYKQNADQNYASLQTTVQNLDGTVQHNKTVADQTAQGFTTRIESLETYKDGESTRANQYFESARTETARQLSVERTAIAKDYVAKSTYTSDVTGIRNELSATTSTANATKTNLANYQASNDKMVASLKSSLQTTDGNVSDLQTKVEAVPGQITSAVSSVEGKIPKSVGGRNLALGTSADWSAGRTSFNGQNNQTSIMYRVYNRGFKIGNRINIRLVLKYSDIVVTEGQTARVSTQFRGNVTDWGSGQLSGGGSFGFDKSGGEIEIKATTVVNENTLKNEYWEWRLRVDYVKSGKIQWKEAKVEVGDLPTPWSPAPEDTAEQISNLSSEIKQTADGMTLLATKTELNSAKTELQSGINTATDKANNAQSTANNNAQTISTHTTQISALNSGLQAKVSQTDFNTLSGRVTTAENNITAKANELSSKITAVEGKIPTTVGSVNLFKDSLDFSGSWVNNDNGIYAEDYQGVKIFKTQSAWGGRSQYFEVKAGEEYVFSAYVKSSAKTDGANFYLYHESKQPVASGVVSSGSVSGQNTIYFELTDKYKRIAIKIKITKDGWIMPRIERGNTNAYLFFGGYKLERGNIATDYSPAPEDAIEEISSLSSELKQTKDGITLLATKTELNTAKNELQSGINTATNKANSNAQTISTHTTQISALNSGLQAKVSQTDFNTLSGRVTTAENNITAKANELSSKITSVEGKIPTSIGSTNLLLYSVDPWQAPQTGYYQFFGTAKTSETYNGAVVYKTSGAWNRLGINLGKHLVERRLLKVGDVLTYSVLAKTDQKTPIQSRLFVRYDNQSGAENISGKEEIINLTNEWKKISVTFTVTKRMLSEENRVNYLGWEQTTNSESGKFVYYTCNKIERGNIATDYSPAPEDTATQISSLTSQIQQTADGMTLLATKTELNSAKNELQSGINTATNKANNNAQTISTHTNQISALNTGLSAKVSQSDFNTLSGRVTSAENNITAKANELSSKITSVEGKIPTNVSTRNLILKSNDLAHPHKQSGANTTVTSTDDYFVIRSTGYTANAWGGMSWNMSISEVKAGEQFSILMPVYIDSSVNLDSGCNFNLKNHSSNSVTYDYSIPTNKKDQWFNVAITFKASKDVKFDTYPFYVYIVKNGLVRIKPPMLVRGNLIPSDWQPAPEDTISDITKLDTTLTQTADGLKQLSTKVTSQGNTITSHTNSINSLTTGLNAKVSQSDFNTLSGRVTTAENNITAKANELSSKITSVEGKLPTSVSHRNLAQGTSSSWSPFVNITTNTNWCYNLATIKYGDSTGIRDGTTINIFVYLSADELTLGGPSPSIRIQGMVIDKNGNLTWTNWDKYHPFKSKWSSNLVSGNNYRIVKLSSKVTSESFSNINGFEIGIRIDGVQSGKFHHRALMVTTGDIFPDSWSPAPEDTINQINSVSSEFKQTTDSIKASVSSLDKSTVKSSSLTINSDGIVMKAGKSTTDVANAIGSYFAVNQNAIDLFADKIKVKGSMIVNGTITGDKIKASSVDVSKIVGIDANFIKSKIEHAMIDWLKGKTITAYNDNMTIDLQNGRISFKDGSNAVYRQTSDGIHTGFLHFEAGSQGGVYAAFGTTSTRQGINSKSSEFAGIRCYRVSANGDSHDAKVDKIEVIGDKVQFGHTYHPNGTIGGGFIMHTAAYYDDPPYSLNRMVSSIESLWRILYVHGKNVGYNLSHPNFINALRDEYNAWHDMHNR